MKYQLSGLNKISENEMESIIYPNPNNGKFNLTNIGIGDVLEILDLTGKLIFHMVAKDGSVTIDLKGKEEGVYDLIIHKSKITLNKKLIITK